MKLFDSHCHIQSAGAGRGEASTRELWAKASDINGDDILERAREANVSRVICVGCDLEDSRLAVEFVQNRDNCWASVGIHPYEASRYIQGLAHRGVDDSMVPSPYHSHGSVHASSSPSAASKPGHSGSLKEFEDLVNKPKVVAIGECGLDYFRDNSSKQDQIKFLKLQIELALTRDLPLIFHVREAFDDFWPIYESYDTSKIRGVLHSFTDSQANLERALGHNLFVGVNGIATFTKKPEQIAMYRSIPLQNLLLETDAPFLTPLPERGKVCEPYHIHTIAEYLARQRSEPVEVLAEATTHNTRQLFGI